MTRRLVPLVAVLALGLAAGVAQAGGSAHVQVLSVPREIVRGAPLEITIAVRPQWPMQGKRNLEPVLKAVSGDQVVTATALPLKADGRYMGTLVLPSAGEWTVTVDSRFCHTEMKPLVLTAAPEPKKKGAKQAS